MIDNKLYNIPCLCSVCGKVYLSSIRLAGGYIKDAWKDGDYLKTKFDCPTCGHWNKLNPSLIDVIEDAINSFKSMPIDILLDLQEKLNKKRAGDFSNNNYEDSKAEILNAAPELQSLKDFIPTTRNEAYGMIQALCAVIGVVLSILLSNESSEKQPQIENVITNQSITINNLPAPILKPNKPQVKKAENVLCPCGSGKKFKWCHGKVK